jgi:acetyl esterase/lipase
MPVHPAFAEHLPLLAGLPSLAEVDWPPSPELLAAIETYQRATTAGGEPPTVPTQADTAPGPHGPVPVRVYQPSSPDSLESPENTRPGLVWLHGGGFLAGDLDMPEADWVSRAVATRADAVVLSVDYRLAIGDVTYPVPHDDAVAAIRWARDSASALGVDPARISVGGASAGGNLAAGAILRIRDEDAWIPAQLVLAYVVAHPVIPAASARLAAAMTEVPRMLQFRPSDIERVTINYLGGPPSTADGYAMPALAVLDGLGPTLLLNAEYDDLRSSGEAFAAALALAGVDVRQVTARGMLHGFLNHSGEIEPISNALDLIADVVAGQ